MNLAKFVVAVILLSSFGCTSKQGDPLTPRQKDQIKNEVNSVIDSMLAKYQRLDIIGALQYFLDSPEFVVYNPDCSRSDFQAIKNSAVGVINAVAAIKMPVMRKEFSVVTKDVVVCTVVGRTELYFKTGDTLAYDPYAATFVFKKIANNWKIVYRHDSATITAQRAAKK